MRALDRPAWFHSAVLPVPLGLCSHSSKINDIAFPTNYSEVFATCSVCPTPPEAPLRSQRFVVALLLLQGSDIRVWNSRTRNELLRIQVPNQECLCVSFTPDGKTILSGNLPFSLPCKPSSESSC